MADEHLTGEAGAEPQPTARDAAAAVCRCCCGSVDSIAGTAPNLRDLTGSRASQPVVVLGYWAPGDGGGGLFYWSTDTTTPDDGGQLIVPTGTRTGCWKRVWDGAVSVRWFGAKGDGNGNDAPAIQTAIDFALGPNTTTNYRYARAAVYLPSGQYALQCHLLVTNAQNFRLFGDGPDSVLFVQRGSSLDSLLEIDGAADCVFEGFSLNYNGNAGSADKVVYLHWSGRVSHVPFRSTERNCFRDIRSADYSARASPSATSTTQPMSAVRSLRTARSPANGWRIRVLMDSGRSAGSSATAAAATTCRTASTVSGYLWLRPASS